MVLDLGLIVSALCRLGGCYGTLLVLTERRCSRGGPTALTTAIESLGSSSTALSYIQVDVVTSRRPCKSVSQGPDILPSRAHLVYAPNPSPGPFATLSQRCLLHTMSSYPVWNATASLKALQRVGNEMPTKFILGNSHPEVGRTKRREELLLLLLSSL